MPLQLPRSESPRTATSSVFSRSQAVALTTNPESVRAEEVGKMVCTLDRARGVSTPPRSSTDNTTVNGCGPSTRTS